MVNFSKVVTLTIAWPRPPRFVERDTLVGYVLYLIGFSIFLPQVSLQAKTLFDLAFALKERSIPDYDVSFAVQNDPKASNQEQQVRKSDLVTKSLCWSSILDPIPHPTISNLRQLSSRDLRDQKRYRWFYGF